MIVQISDVVTNYENPGLSLEYCFSDKVTGSMKASHSNKKDVRMYHFEVVWVNDKPEVTNLNVTGLYKESNDPVRRGITGSRSDLYADIIRKCSFFRDKILRHQRHISFVIKNFCNNRILIFVPKRKKNEFSVYRLASQGKKFEYFFFDKYLVFKTINEVDFQCGPWNTLYLNNSSIEVASLISEGFHLDYFDEDLAIDMARKGESASAIRSACTFLD